jgi:hypothetical protein
MNRQQHIDHCRKLYRMLTYHMDSKAMHAANLNAFIFGWHYATDAGLRNALQFARSVHAEVAAWYGADVAGDDERA